MVSNLVVSGGSNELSIGWNQEQVEIIKNQIAKGCSDGELALFGQVCTRTGLDPFSRQIYAISRGGKMTIQTSIDGFRTIAARSGLYGGSSTEWCGDDGVWLDVWLSSKPPAAAKTTVYRKGCPNPFTGVARYGAYQQGNSMWSKMPDVMIGKVSEALALRKAFPAELSGIYSGDEMEQAGMGDGISISEPKKIDLSGDSQSVIAQYQSDLKIAFDKLGWDNTRKSGWAKTINPAPFAQWTQEDYKLALHRAYAEIDKLNDIVGAITVG